MSEISKRKLKYEILEGIENYLNGQMENMKTENEYNENPENWADGEIPKWRLEDVETNKAKMAIIDEIMKGLLKL